MSSDVAQRPSCATCQLMGAYEEEEETSEAQSISPDGVHCHRLTVWTVSSWQCSLSAALPQTTHGQERCCVTAAMVQGKCVLFLKKLANVVGAACIFPHHKLSPRHQHTSRQSWPLARVGSQNAQHQPLHSNHLSPPSWIVCSSHMSKLWMRPFCVTSLGGLFCAGLAKDM